MKKNKITIKPSDSQEYIEPIQHSYILLSNSKSERRSFHLG